MGILSVEHLVPLALLVVAAVVLCVAARRTPGRWIDAVAAIIALVLVIAELSWQPYVLANRAWSVGASLPVQLCDVGGFVAAAALLWRQLFLVEIAYFWGLGGTLQAVLTPDLGDQHFPSFPYLQFYVTHDLVILAALFLVIGLALYPRPRAVRRIFLLTLAFAVVVGLLDLVTGGNYMYLRQVPASGSLLNLMGPWPWYIAAGAVLTLVVLAILNAPFRLSRLGGHDAG
ncbi:MAG TPA: TIGR02206 family membrane protein [Candidatus Dormibacteraeota bacterium]|nr:TIGR02206 family membrane protein [Candidatus Dormibacteraeota bacterium]